MTNNYPLLHIRPEVVLYYFLSSLILMQCCVPCGKNGRDFGTVDPNCHNTSKFKNGVSSHVPIGET